MAFSDPGNSLPVLLAAAIQETMDAAGAIATQAGAVATAQIDAKVQQAQASLDGKVSTAGLSATQAETARTEAQNVALAIGAAPVQATLVATALDASTLRALYYSSSSNAATSPAGTSFGHWRGFDVGPDIPAGGLIDGAAFAPSVGATATQIQVRLYRTPTADAGVNLPPGQAGDTLVASVILPIGQLAPFDGGATGIIANTAERDIAALFPAPVPVGAAGLTYKLRIDAFDASSAPVQINIGNTTGVAGETRQRAAGGRYSSTGANTNQALTNRPSIGLVARVVQSATAVRATIDLAAQRAVQLSADRLADHNSRNHDRLASEAALFDRALPDAITESGDSLVANAEAVNTGNRASDILARFVTGAVNNIAVGGTRTDQIIATFAALPAGQRDDHGITNGGTNDIGQQYPTTATVVDTVLANMQSLVTANPNRIIMGPWVSGGGPGRAWTQARKINRAERAAYGARFFDALTFLARWTSGNVAEDTAAAAGAVPSSLTVDLLHPGPAGCALLGREQALILRADTGIGAPYLHDDRVGALDVAGANVHTMRTLGAVVRYMIVSGNDDGAFEIGPTDGVIKRTSTGTMSAVTGLYVQAIGMRGRSNVARIVVGRRRAEAVPSVAVRIKSNGAAVMSAWQMDGAAASKELTIVIAGRMTSTVSRGYLSVGSNTTGTTSPFVSKDGKRFRFFARDAAGALLGSNYTPFCRNPFDLNVWFLTVNTATGVASLRTGVNEEATLSVAVTTPDGLLDLTQIVQLFFSTGSLLDGFDHVATWIAQASINIADPVVRALFYDSATRRMRDLGDGTVGGVRPLIYIKGGIGDLMTGRNYGSGGDMHVPPYTTRGLAGHEEVAV
jgi:hypothetical protein